MEEYFPEKNRGVTCYANVTYIPKFTLLKHKPKRIKEVKLQSIPSPPPHPPLFTHKKGIFMYPISTKLMTKNSDVKPPIPGGNKNLKTNEDIYKYIKSKLEKHLDPSLYVSPTLYNVENFYPIIQIKRKTNHEVQYQIKIEG